MWYKIKTLLWLFGRKLIFGSKPKYYQDYLVQISKYHQDYQVQISNTIKVVWYKTQIPLRLFGTNPKYHYGYLVQVPNSHRIIWYKRITWHKNITIMIIQYKTHLTLECVFYSCSPLSYQQSNYHLKSTIQRYHISLAVISKYK